MAKAKRKAPTAQKIVFLKSPTGKYGLAYAEGDTYDITDPDVLAEMVETGFAKVID